MRLKFELAALAVLLAGVALFASPRTALAGVVFVAGGGYGLLLPRLVRPEDYATR